MSLSESLGSTASSASSTASIFGGAEGTLFDELRVARSDIETCWSTFKAMHRRFHKEGRTPANAMDRRDCDALQINVIMQLTSLQRHVKSEWEEDPEKVPEVLVDDVAIYVEKRSEAVRARPKVSPENFNDEDDDDEDDDDVDYTKPPPKGKKVAPADRTRTSTPIVTKPASTPTAEKTPSLVKRTRTRLDSDANKFSPPKKEFDQRDPGKSGDNDDNEGEISVVMCDADDAAQEQGGGDDDEAEEKRVWEKEMAELEVQRNEIKRRTAETKLHVEEKKKKAEDMKEKVKKAEKAKEEAEEKRRRKEALRKRKEENEKKVALARVKYEREKEDFEILLKTAKEIDDEVKKSDEDYAKLWEKKTAPSKIAGGRLPKKRATTTMATASTSASGVTPATTAATKIPANDPHQCQQVVNDGHIALARVRSQQLAMDTAKEWRPSKKFINGTRAEYRDIMNEFERVEALEGLNSRLLLQELRHYFGGSAGGIVEAHLKCRDSNEGLAKAKSILDDLFGQKIDSTTALMEEILDGGQIDRDDYQAHIALYKDLVELCITSESSDVVEKIDTRENVHKIVRMRLVYASEEFHKKEVKLIREQGRHSTMDELREKISERLKIIDNKKAGETEPVVGRVKKRMATTSEEPQQPQQTQQPQQQQRQLSLELPLPQQQPTTRSYASTMNSFPQQQPRSPLGSGEKRCLVCSAAHAPLECNYLKNLTVDARVEVLKSKNLCFRCFGAGHSQRVCMVEAVCSICYSRGHQTLLHGRAYPPRVAAGAATTPTATAAATVATVPSREDQIPALSGAGSEATAF